jgi:hypothetical protein
MTRALITYAAHLMFCLGAVAVGWMLDVDLVATCALYLFGCVSFFALGLLEDLL